MLAVNYTNLRDNMKKYMDKVTDDYETMIVTRKDNKNVVMLSEEAYNNLMENVYVMGNKANYDWHLIGDVCRQHTEQQQYKKQNLLERQFTAEHPNQIWVSDITYFKVNDYWVYLCVIGRRRIERH